MNDCCILTLFTAILLNLLVLIVFFKDSLGISTYRSSYQLQIQFYFFLPIWMPFISFSCLIALARTSNMMLNKSGKSGQTCLMLDIRRSAFSFSLLSMMLAIGLSYVAFIILRYVPSTSTLLRVIINGR